MASKGRSKPKPGATAWLGFGTAAVAMLAAVRGQRESPERHDAATVKEAHEQLERARADFGASLGQPLAFFALVDNAGLDRDEAEVLAVIAAAEIDPGLHHLVGRLQADASKNRLTLGTIAELFALDPFASDHRGVLALGVEAPLPRAALVDVVRDGPWADSVVALHPSVAWALVGDTSSDPDLPDETHRLEVDAVEGDPLVVVSGPDRERCRLEAALRCVGTNFVATPAPDSAAGWAALVRDATITGSGLIVEVEDSLPADGRTWIDRAVHVPWAISTRRDLPIEELPRRPWREFAVLDTEPTDSEWSDVLGAGVERSHHLTLDQLVRVGRAFRANEGDLDGAVRRLAGGRLERLARRIRPSRTWDDIVLSPDRLDLLHSIVDRHRHSDQVYEQWGFRAMPSRGLVVLFSGPSGTGKTLATEIIAGALGLDVFKLDLSSVVSKYIGETEKNLERVFDAASAGNVVLFFDEADAIFGKRSEVKDARDRYANIEVSYLLQRLEAYDGVVILATNFEKNVDEAFVRRIHTRVDFALPGIEERRAIWAQNFPHEAPVDGIDTDWLAEQFEMSGGSIRNAAVHAAFLAATEDSKITMACVVRGVAREYRKIGRLLKAADFGNYYDHAVGEVEA